MKIYDAAIIGGGIIGGVITYQLSNKVLDLIVFEKNSVIADETTRVNSGVIHGGFDPDPHKVEARLNVLGNQLWREKIFKDLKFPCAQIDSVIIAFNKKEIKHLEMLYKRGIKNQVPKEFMKIIDAKELILKEPNINKDVKKALVCTSSWMIDPVAATKAFFGVALNNGATLKRSSKVTAIKWMQDHFEITINDNNVFYAKNIINAAGHYADEIAKLAGYPDFQLTTRRGQYRILDRSEKGIVNSILFMVPTIHGKGVIVAPMFDGHVLVGPTAEDGIPKAETNLVTQENFDYIGKIGTKIIPNLKLDKTIMTLAGSRPIDIATNDFVINYANKNKHFINAAGMQSPAIASAPAIALEIEKLLKENGTKIEVKTNFNPKFKIMY